MRRMRIRQAGTRGVESVVSISFFGHFQRTTPGAAMAGIIANSAVGRYPTCKSKSVCPASFIIRGTRSGKWLSAQSAPVQPWSHVAKKLMILGSLPSCCKSYVSMAEKLQLPCIELPPIHANTKPTIAVAMSGGVDSAVSGQGRAE